MLFIAFQAITSSKIEGNKNTEKKKQRKKNAIAMLCTGSMGNRNHDSMKPGVECLIKQYNFLRDSYSTLKFHPFNTHPNSDGGCGDLFFPHNCFEFYGVENSTQNITCLHTAGVVSFECPDIMAIQGVSGNINAVFLAKMHECGSHLASSIFM